MKSYLEFEATSGQPSHHDSALVSRTSEAKIRGPDAKSDVVERWAPAQQRSAPLAMRSIVQCGVVRYVRGVRVARYGGRSRAAIQASAR